MARPRPRLLLPAAAAAWWCAPAQAQTLRCTFQGEVASTDRCAVNETSSTAFLSSV